MILDDLPRNLRPTVQVIDDWVTNRKLGLVFEARVGSGKLLVCSVDLTSQLESDPVRRQFRRSLLDYLASGRFDPLIPITAEQARQVSAPPSPLEKLGARLRASSHQPGHEPALAIDGNPATLWHTAWGDPMPSFPHELTLELNSLTRLYGLTFLPRQDNNRNGWIKDYTLHASSDGTRWGEPVAAGTFAADAALKTVRFPIPITARSVRLTARSGHANGPWASLAELGLLLEP
ncbi:MAG: discoidin domain-containing protein [Verrucomicrobia bacterium]|nr:discoidin domain-containing protein [Verrucomicrobiota bacterium]